MTATTLITGNVTGFVLVIDPNNEKGKLETIRFDDAVKLSARRRKLILADNAEVAYDPTETQFWTEFKRDDDGEIEQEFSYDPSGNTVIGTRAYRGMCKCGAISWMRITDSDSNPTGQFACADCNKTDPNDDFTDFTNYAGTNVREY